MRVAIIGGGAAGITSGKACHEEDIDYICFERTGGIAGLWNYHDDDAEGKACVMKSTVINSSKEMTSFSDFPVPKQYPNYMHNRKMLKYLLSYANSFGFLEHIRYHHEVVNVVQAHDYDETGKWVVTAKNSKDGTFLEEVFDGVMVCIGHHGYPYIPKFKGQSDFKGKIMHSRSLKTPDTFKDERVLVVGIGNSGIDAAVEISNVAKQVYLSTRRGAWISYRVGPNGYPNDAKFTTRAYNILIPIFGRRISDAYMEDIMNSYFDHAAYNLRPKHRFSEQHITVNDHLPNKILSGTIIVKGDVDFFNEKGVVFEDDEALIKLDTVVLATGYEIKFPFLSRSIIDVKNNDVELYKYVFPPQLKHSSLGIIGLIQPIGALFNVFEAQARWYVQLLKKNVNLPPYDHMIKDIKQKQQILKKRYVQSPRHTVQVDYIEFLDELYSEIGAKPNLIKMAVTDPLLFYHVFFGPAVTYQYRLQGPHMWPEARKTIIDTSQRMWYPLQTRKNHEKNNIFQSVYFFYISYAFVIFFVCGVLFNILLFIL